MAEGRQWLIVGIGNPGREYAMTRHNLGFMVVTALAERLNLSWRDEDRYQGLVCKGTAGAHTVHLLKPMTYVNLSGESVRRYLDYYKMKAENVVIVVDDAALGFGELRVRVVGSSGGHNGLKSIEALLGTHHYARLRMGIGSSGQRGMADHVLSPFFAEEKAALPGVVGSGVDALMLLFESNLTRVMNEVNTKKKNETPSNGAGEQE